MSNKKVLVTALRVRCSDDDWSSSVEGIRVTIVDRNTDEELVNCDIGIKNSKNFLSLFDEEDIVWSDEPIYMIEEEDGVYYSPDEGEMIVFEVKTKEEAINIVRKYYK